MERRDEQRDDDRDPFDLGHLDNLVLRVLREIVEAIDETLILDDRKPIQVVHHHRAAERDLLRDVCPRALLGQQLMNSVASSEVAACHRA